MTTPASSPTSGGAAFSVRAKTAADGDACVALMRRTHDLDGYPRYWPARPDRFLSPSHETDAWVAERDGRVVGQVALHQAAGDPVLALAQESTGLGVEAIAVLARLLVDPDVRGLGVGRALIATATARAYATQRRPVLDVLKTNPGPIALYERLGWTRLGETTLPLDGLGYGDVPPLELWVYLGPAAA